MNISAPQIPILCSIVITNYNQKQFVEQAIRSAAEQTYVNKEIIVVDDGSTDGSPEFLKEIQGQYNFQLVVKPNGGTASARNAGVKASKGQFIAFLDADDYYYPNKVEYSVGKLIPHAELGIAYSDYDIWFTQQNTKRREFKWAFDFQKNTQFCVPATNSVIKRHVWEALGGFDETIKGMEDYDFWLRASLKFAFCHIPFSLFCYREHGANKTSTTLRADWIKEETAVRERFLKNAGLKVG